MGYAPTALERLLDRHAAEVVEQLQRTYRRALVDNPGGCALLAGAVREALLCGVGAQCELEKLALEDLDADRSDAWPAWRLERAETPEGATWPEHLAVSRRAAVARAAELLDAAGLELGFNHGRRRTLREVGEESAEAGSALVRALTREPEPEGPARVGHPANIGPPQPDGTVRVAMAANQAECELLQGVLKTAGIPSVWRRTGADLPQLMSAGHREVYVPAAAAADAQALLATLEPTREDAPPPRTRAIGLEHTGMRLAGKATAILTALGFVGLVPLAAADHPALAVLLLIALLALIAAAVGWSEHKTR